MTGPLNGSPTPAGKSLLGQAALLLPALMLLASCVSDLSAVKEMRADINDLRQNSYQTERDMQELKKSVSSLKTGGGGAPSQETLEAIRKGQEGLYEQVTDMQREVQLLNGKLDETTFRYDQRLQKASAEIELLKSKIEDLPKGQAAPEGIGARLDAIEAEINRLKAQVAAPGGAKEAPPAKTPKATSPENAYDEAYAAFKAKRYEESREKMGKFLREHPGHKLAGNAQFWIAESYYAEKDYDDAILAYEEVLQKYKGNQKVPAAMLKQAYAFRELGDKRAARGILRELIGRFPDSPQAKAAEEDLKTLSE
jgi:tol-pal system protein YbgF